jgi:hypothetical protein
VGIVATEEVRVVTDNVIVEECDRTSKKHEQVIFEDFQDLLPDQIRTDCALHRHGTILILGLGLGLGIWLGLGLELLFGGLLRFGLRLG